MTGQNHHDHKPPGAELAMDLRGKGLTWVEVAAELRGQLRVNALVSFRVAHCWTQFGAAREWNQRWPNEPKTNKNFSYWESFPSPTGYVPSQRSLWRLAELYQCAVSDLLEGLGDFRHLDEVRQVQPLLPACPYCHKVLPLSCTSGMETRRSA